MLVLRVLREGVGRGHPETGGGLPLLRGLGRVSFDEPGERAVLDRHEPELASEERGFVLRLVLRDQRNHLRLPRDGLLRRPPRLGVLPGDGLIRTARDLHAEVRELRSACADSEPEVRVALRHVEREGGVLPPLVSLLGCRADLEVGSHGLLDRGLRRGRGGLLARALVSCLSRCDGGDAHQHQDRHDGRDQADAKASEAPHDHLLVAPQSGRDRG